MSCVVWQLQGSTYTFKVNKDDQPFQSTEPRTEMRVCSEYQSGAIHLPLSSRSRAVPIRLDGYFPLWVVTKRA
eukprot:24962-Eustigmatos_ZCMA.PRE.1